MFKTADLYGAHAEEVQVVAPIFRHFGGVRFSPGEWLYADEDGILACAGKLD